MTLIRLNKALSYASIASRRKADDIIFSKKVKVNGKIVDNPSILIDIEKDTITIADKPIGSFEKKVVFMLNKPKGYICSTKKLFNEKIVLDLFINEPYRLFPIGRLDKETEGLILVGNDGEFAHRVIHPSFNISKEYLIKVTQEITHKHLVTLSRGIYIDKAKVVPTKVVKVRKGTCKITIKEGKKHEIRLLCAHAQLDIIELIRIRVGPLNLGSLPLGQYRKLNENEKKFFIK